MRVLACQESARFERKRLNIGWALPREFGDVVVDRPKEGVVERCLGRAVDHPHRLDLSFDLLFTCPPPELNEKDDVDKTDKTDKTGNTQNNVSKTDGKDKKDKKGKKGMLLECLRNGVQPPGARALPVVGWILSLLFASSFATTTCRPTRFRQG